ncbi:hypothetical protein [Mycolicibacterium neworleansense]|uniref:PE-PGRS family protein n=1 Tax=Mycolicibacterium neworleansense TaxID=146018 RepID=A0A0H5RWL5_9MYCO|nr:hypothetical protein [Mycolicibacterium neworleansense]MCV7360784.1 hypothetical protein [Mycolicibacterium neworleansense]CRZ18211.1 PE-PGRS family protein [Mycolicibacterium neworleansense]
MAQALRPYVTAGIAIAGAGVIAVTPVSTPPPQPSVQYSSVHLSGSVQSLDSQLTAEAAANAIPPELTPAEAYQYFAMLTAAYVMDAIAPIVSNPTPILSQILANQFWYANILTMGTVTGATNLLWTLEQVPEYLSTAAAQLMAGDPAAAITTLWNNVVVGSVMAVGLPLVPALQIPVAISQNIANVVAATPMMVMGLGFDALATANSTVGAVTASIRSIVDSASSGDPTAVLNAVLTAPAKIASGFLIGGYPEGNTGLINGVIKHLVLARETIAEALGAPPREIPEGATASAKAPARIASIADETTTETAASDGAEKPAAPEPEAKPTLVRTSAKAVPGKVGLTGKHRSEAPKLAKSISDHISTAVKKAFTKPDKKDSGSGSTSPAE